MRSRSISSRIATAVAAVGLVGAAVLTGGGSSAAATSGTITTVAGPGTACSPPTGTCGDGGAAVSAQLYGVDGSFVAPNGDLYFAECDNNRVRKVDAATGKISTVGSSRSKRAASRARKSAEMSTGT